MSSDRLHRIFLYGISLLRANITSVYAAQKDAKRTRARIAMYGRVVYFGIWVYIYLSFNFHLLLSITSICLCR